MPVDRPTDPDGLTIKQRAFVHAYVGKAQGNGIQACKLAGYKGSDKTLKALAHKQINHPLISQAILKFALATQSEAVLTVTEAKEILSAIARDTDEEAKDRIAAIDKLLKSGGAYVFKHEVDHKGAAEVHVYLPSNGRD